MKSRYQVISISDYSRSIGENNVDIVLQTFDCGLNLEVQNFLLRKAMQAEKLKSAITYLVFDAQSTDLVGYFTLVLKSFSILRDKLSSNNRKLISRFAELNERSGEYTTALYLIAQIGKKDSPPKTSRTSRTSRELNRFVSKSRGSATLLTLR